MLHGLHLKNVGPAPALDLNPAPRLNLLTGDNGLDKTFLASRLLRTWKRQSFVGPSRPVPRLPLTGWRFPFMQWLRP